jgi:hypothetical protein
MARPGTLREAIHTTLARMRTPNTRFVRENEFRQLRSSFERVPEADRPALAEETTRLMRSSRRMLWGEEFAVPVIAINATRRFAGLEGRVIGRKSDLAFVSRAEQVVRFRLDETGTRLRSEAVAEGLFGGGPPRSLVFDEPFLLLLIRNDKPWPYLAVWVGSAEVLERVSAAENATSRPAASDLFGDQK